MSSVAYREAVVAAPGVVFHTMRGLAIGFLALVASLAGVHCVGLLSAVACTAWLKESTCTRFDPGPFVDAIGISEDAQRAFVRFPIPLTATMMLAALATIVLLRPITVLLDTATRSLLLRTGRWPRRIRTTRIRLEDVEIIEVHGIAGMLCAVRVIDVRGSVHEITGHRLGHARANAIAIAIQSATG